MLLNGGNIFSIITNEVVIKNCMSILDIITTCDYLKCPDAPIQLLMSLYKNKDLFSVYKLIPY